MIQWQARLPDEAGYRGAKKRFSLFVTNNIRHVQARLKSEHLFVSCFLARINELTF